MRNLAICYSDSYKQCHPRMYPEELWELVSYWVPRRSMFAENDEMIFFGLQAFLIKLKNLFDEEFFSLPEDVVIEEYKEIMGAHLGLENIEIMRIRELHQLGYLPIQIRAIPEGSRVPMGVPCIELTNTKIAFAWVVQWIECILQTELWKPCCHATMADKFYQIAKSFYDKTSEADPRNAMSDFGMRGMSGIEEAVKASSSWLLSFNKTSTIAAIPYIEENYKECPAGVGKGAVSTEHSVMSANYAVDGDEITFVKRMLTELYPNSSFSMVSDTYDYWNIIDNILPACKKEIMEHNGKLLVRPDSGDIVEISVTTVQKLWDIFGGSLNSKGYRVLDPHIGIIYGDGCTLEKVTEIYDQLEKLGFASDNILFGVGAFSFAAMTTQNGMILYTRDTYGIAMKATCANIRGKVYPIYKDPKTDTSKLKKSHKGCVRVYKSEGVFCYEDGLETIPTETELKTVFKDGSITKMESFEEIRDRMVK